MYRYGIGNSGLAATTIVALTRRQRTGLIDMLQLVGKTISRSSSSISLSRANNGAASSAAASTLGGHHDEPLPRFSTRPQLSMKGPASDSSRPKMFLLPLLSIVSLENLDRNSSNHHHHHHHHHHHCCCYYYYHCSIGHRRYFTTTRCSSSSSISSGVMAENVAMGSRRSSKEFLIFGRHVREAIANGQPIVALESTVITHGLPEPQNLDLALSLEHEISCGRKSESESESGRSDCTPATIGIIRGQIVVGMSKDEIKFLANRECSRPIKASRRDIPIALARGLSAGTTVAATMAIASSCLRQYKFVGVQQQQQQQQRESRKRNQSLIKVFATGGTGGVHRGGELSMDISADLYEFARSPMGVVSSGFKSFLDTRRSLEFLETLGCTVVSLTVDDLEFKKKEDEKEKGKEKGLVNDGDENANEATFSLSSGSNHKLHRLADQISRNQRDIISTAVAFTNAGANFPAFYSRDSGIKSPFSVDSIKEAAEILFQCLEGPLSEQRGMLLANPIGRNVELFYDHVDDDDSKTTTTKMDLDELLANVSAQIDKRTDLEGKEKTPLILEEINRLTKGKSLKANVELLKSNARVGAQLAIEYAYLLNATDAASTSTTAITDLEGPSVVSVEEFSSVSESGAGADIMGGSSNSIVIVPEHSSRFQSAHQHDVDEQKQSPEARAGGRRTGRPVVVGCTMIDMHVSTKIDDQFRMNPPFSGATFLGQPHLTVGGVARNLATALKYLGHRPHFLTALARDNLAKLALDQFEATGFSMLDNELKVSWFPAIAGKTDTCNRGGLNVSIAPSSSSSSSCFALVLMDSIRGQCEYVIANLEAIKAISPETIEQNCSNCFNSIQDNNCDHQFNIISKETPLLIMDANLRADTIKSIVVNCHRERVPIFLEPTDVLALPRLVNCIKELRQSTNNTSCIQSILCLSPNLLELQTMIELFRQVDDGNKPDPSQMSLEEIEKLANYFMVNCMPELTCLLVTLDKRGVMLAVRMSSCDNGHNLDNIQLMNTLNYEETTTNNEIKMKHFEPLQVVEKPVSASGAGDSFAAGFISGLIDNLKLSDCIKKGFKASLLALNARDTIPASLKSITRH